MYDVDQNEENYNILWSGIDDFIAKMKQEISDLKEKKSSKDFESDLEKREKEIAILKEQLRYNENSEKKIVELQKKIQELESNGQGDVESNISTLVRSINFITDALKSRSEIIIKELEDTQARIEENNKKLPLDKNSKLKLSNDLTYSEIKAYSGRLRRNNTMIIRYKILYRELKFLESKQEELNNILQKENDDDGGFFGNIFGGGMSSFDRSMSHLKMIDDSGIKTAEVMSARAKVVGKLKRELYKMLN